MIAQGLANLGFKALQDFICQDDGSGPYIAEWLSSEPQPTSDEIASAAANPPPVAAKAVITSIARISGLSPAAIIDGAGLLGVTRISVGRYRLTHAEEMPDTRYGVNATAEDAAVRSVRAYPGRTTKYFELRSTDQAGAPADTREITVQISRVE